MKKLFLVDAYALIFKYYYAFLSFPMRSPDGQNTSAIFGFIKFLNDIISKRKPDCIAVAFDLSGGTFRNELYPLYKANRQETPEDIISSAVIIKEILSAMNITVLEKSGWEADDVIGTISKRAAATGQYEVYIVSPDKDLGQLVDDNIKLYRQGKGGREDEIIGKREICEHYGISDPGQIADILAIWGDSADNIPGVPGIGEKGASKLVAEWGSVEGIIENVDKLKPKQALGIQLATDQIRLSKTLATIALDVPLEISCDDLEIKEPDVQTLGLIYRRLGFRSLASSLPKTTVQSETPENKDASAASNVINAGKEERQVSVRPSSLDNQDNLVIHSLFDDPSNDDSLSSGVRVKEKITLPKPIVQITADTVLSSVSNVVHTYQTLTDEEKVRDIVRQIETKGVFALKTVATSVEPMRAEFVGISVSIEAHTAYWIREKKLVGLFRGVLESEGIAKVGHNLKYDMTVLRNTFGYKIGGSVWDTMLMHYILYPENKHSIDYISSTELLYEVISFENIVGKGTRVLPVDRVEDSVLAEFSAERVDVSLQLFEHLRVLIESSGKNQLYRDIEEPLVRVLADMEFNGVRVDQSVLSSISQSLSERVSQIENEIVQVSGVKDLNVNSPRQLGHVLFDVLKVDPNPKLTKTSNYKTDEETLLKLAGNHPIINMILDYRGLRKLLSTYVDALPELVNPKTGKIHTSFNQAVTATGRLSSSNPNLQNIPVRDADGREIRKAFVASEKGWKIVSADYSQVELRIMAHLSMDRHLLAAFNSGEDIHAATAAKLFKKPVSEVTKDERRKAKVANFGIIYGISSFGLSGRLQMPMREAKRFIEDYYLSFPDVKRYIDNAIAEAKVNGYVTTIFSRHRELPEIRSNNSAARKFAERNAINAPIQGSAADIMKIAMAKVYGEIQKRGLQSRMLLQIHDEIVLEVPESEIETVREILTAGMTHAADLRVPLDIEIGVGDCWLDAH